MSRTWTFGDFKSLLFYCNNFNKKSFTLQYLVDTFPSLIIEVLVYPLLILSSLFNILPEFESVSSHLVFLLDLNSL